MQSVSKLRKNSSCPRNQGCHFWSQVVRKSFWMSFSVTICKNFVWPIRVSECKSLMKTCCSFITIHQLCMSGSVQMTCKKVTFCCRRVAAGQLQHYFRFSAACLGCPGWTDNQNFCCVQWKCTSSVHCWLATGSVSWFGAVLKDQVWCKYWKNKVQHIMANTSKKQEGTGLIFDHWY